MDVCEKDMEFCSDFLFSKHFITESEAALVNELCSSQEYISANITERNCLLAQKLGRETCNISYVSTVGSRNLFALTAWGLIVTNIGLYVFLLILIFIQLFL